MGLAFGSTGAVVLGYLAGVKLILDEAIGGRVPLLLLGALLFLTGVILVSFGLMGELLVRDLAREPGQGDLRGAGAPAAQDRRPADARR